jgi:TolB-like protein/Tfp pilus assembly protein PilF
MAEGHTQRRLAAILAADVVGYSRLMEQDEAETLAALKVRRKGILEPLVSKHHGRVFKVTGDGVLVEFGSAVNAVQCAVDLQQAMAGANGGQPADRHIVLRIGVNLGDVVVEGRDLYGDSVNIAARLEAMAQPGGIWVSGTAYDHVKNKVKVGFDDLGVQNLRNIAEPVRAYRVAGMAAIAVGTTAPAADKPSIAVLPFTNMSGDPEQQYFGDGVTEDIITELSRFRDLFVIARHSCFQYRDKAVDVKSVGRDLGARFVVEGSFRRSGTRVRISAQLIDAETGNHLWAERYDRDLADIFILQEELAHTIAATIGGRVDAAGRDRATRLGPAGLRAYDLVLRGEALQLNFNRIDMEQAHALALRAIDIDPTNARAHVLYASCCFNISAAHWTAERDRVFEEAVQHARRAVALDSSDSVTQHMLGFLDIFRREYEEARIHCEKALESNPNDTDARTFYAVFLIATGQPDAAIEQLDLVKRHNPFDLYWVPWVKGIAFFTAHRYEDAIAVLKQIPEPINEIRGWLAASYAQAGRLTEAKASLDEFLRVAKHDMVVYPGNRLKDWESYWHAVLQYRDQRDFDHLFEGLRKAGMPA